MRLPVQWRLCNVVLRSSESDRKELERMPNPNQSVEFAVDRRSPIAFPLTESQDAIPQSVRWLYSSNREDFKSKGYVFLSQECRLWRRAFYAFLSARLVGFQERFWGQTTIITMRELSCLKSTSPKVEDTPATEREVYSYSERKDEGFLWPKWA